MKIIIKSDLICNKVSLLHQLMLKHQTKIWLIKKLIANHQLIKSQVRKSFKKTRKIVEDY